MSNITKKIMAMLLTVIMFISILPLNVFAAINFDMSQGEQDYYQLLSKRDWNLAPGIEETEVVLNNESGTRRQVLHTVTVDLNNPYTKVIPGYKGMQPEMGNYGTESTSVQALNAEKLGYGNVVAATNTTLSWYTEAYYKANPQYIGEPLGYSIVNGEYYTNSRGHGVGASTVIIINYDKHPLTGEERPDEMPKVWIRKSSDPLTGWEEQAIPVSFGFLVKPDENGNPVNQYKSVDHGNGIAARTFVGVKADGTLVVTVSDGEQAPYSTGFTNYEMADYMIKMGCVIAANCDGGGSTTFCSQRPGEDLKVNCSLADGGERPTTSTILVISTAPADGVFAKADISTEYNYYTPGSIVNFSALGSDAVGTKVDIPSNAKWTIKEDGMGTIENGVFTSNGTEGTVTAQLWYEYTDPTTGTVTDKLAGEKTITIAVPDRLYFDQPIVTVPYGKTAKIPVKASATINGVAQEIGLGSNDITFTFDEFGVGLGHFEGLNFTAVEEANAPEVVSSTLTATLNMGTNPSTTVTLQLGKASEVLWDFEGGQADIDIWNVVNNRKNAAHWDYEMKLSLADRTNGQVHDGNYSMRLETNGLSSKDSHAEQYAWIRLGVDGDATILENARSIGFWLYVPEDNVQCMVQGHYMTDSNGDGTFDTESIVNMMIQENVYYNIDESGWHYLSMDISAFEKIKLAAAKQYDKDPSDGMTGETGEFFIALIFHKATNNLLWSESGSINGNYTYYLDNFTVDYSDAVDDRENPVFDKIYLDGTTALVKRDVVTTTKNLLNISVAVADQMTKLDADKNEIPLYNTSGLDADTAKVYIDGVEVPSTFANGVISASAKVTDGYHRIKTEICDNAGNKSVVIRVVKVESGEEAFELQLVPADPTLDRIPFGSIYYMNLEANDIESIQKVETVIDLNNVNHWQLDNMDVLYGFSAEYTIEEETNTATIIFTRTGDISASGNVVLAKIPVRILYFDTDIKVPGYTAETYWTNYPFWPQDMKMDVDLGLITHTDGTTSTFSNEEFHVDTEMFTDRPHMAQVDFEYLNSHGTTHVHTPVTIADKAPTCIENGYTNRTFCEGCNSVVEWGTTIPATGHTYNVSGDNLICDCGLVSTATGLQNVNGKYYYTTNGILTGGWITIDEDWYYFDTKTYSNVSTYYNGYVTYEFEPDGKLISGKWHHSSAGSRYYYGPSYLRGGKNTMTWYEIDGEQYCIPKDGYVRKGLNWINVVNGKEIYDWYVFDDETGALKERYYGNGLHECEGEYYYLKDGVSQYGMYIVDGEYYYFYFTDRYVARRSEVFYCRYNKGLLPEGYYRFDDKGRMLNNDVYAVNGTLYYFVLGNESQGTGTVEINGVEWKIDDTGKVLFTGFTKDNDGKYQYYENGVQDGNHNWGEGVVTKEPTCTETGIKTFTCTDCDEVKNDVIAVFAHKDEDGDYICDKCDTVVPHMHVWDNGTITVYATCAKDGERTFKCICGETKTEVIAAPGHIDENGDLSCEVCNSTIATKTGLVFDENGNVRYYKNGVVQKSYGLVQDSDGNYYYINSSGVAVKNCTYSFSEAKANGLLPGGSYNFDETGKMINPPTSAEFHKHVWDEGTVTTEAKCETEGVITYVCDCGLLKTTTIDKLGHIDDIHDYKCDRCEENIEHNHVWDDGVVTDEPSCIETGVKTFTCACGETYTETIKELGHKDEDADFKCDKCDTVVEHDHVWDTGVVTKKATCTEKGIKTYTCLCAETYTAEIPAIGYHVDENGDLTCDVCEGTLAAKTGLVFDADGNVRYYKNGVAVQSYGLAKDSEGNYYYINSSSKAVKNCTYTFSTAKANGLLPGGTYKFDATGKMIDPPVVDSEEPVVPPHTHVWDEGVITTNPTCTASGVKTYTCSCNETKTEVVLALGHIDENTDYSCDRCGVSVGEPPVDPDVKNGLVFDDDGEIRYYKDGVAVQSYGLVQDADGNYYYINSSKKAVKNCTYAFSTAKGNGLLLGGTYQFDADGKMINPPV